MSGTTPNKTIPIDEQILDLLRRRGGLTLCEMYQALPYDSSGGDAELDGPLLELERCRRVRSGDKRTTRWGRFIVWHLVEDV